MKTIKIYICDSEKAEYNNDLGVDKYSNDEIYKLVDLKFDETKMNGYWVDPVINAVGVRNIIFYLSGETLTTPLTAKSLAILDSCLD